MPYSPEFYDPSSYLTEDVSAGTILSDRTSRIWALDLHLDDSFPVTFPRTFDAAPLRISSLDLTPDGTALGAYQYEGRLLEAPVVVSQALDEFGGLRQGETLRFRCTANPPHGGADLHAWVAAEHRGKVVEGWLVDLDPQTLAPLDATQAFRGEILAMADDPGTVDILVRVFDIWALTQPVPVSRVDASWAPYAPAAGLGQIVPHGIGIGRRIRCHPIKARSLDDTLIALTATADAGTDALTIAAGHDWVTGDGPVRLTSTGTLPGGVSVGVDYFVVMLDDTTIRLATTRGNATADEVVDLTSAGSGTISVTSGIAPNLDDHTDFVVGVGNVAVNQVWLDGETEAPEWPLDYQVLTQVYRANGRYLTVIRLPGEWSESVVEADVLRVDPDVDGSCVLDLKFSRGFQDDARQVDAIPAALTTGDLVRGAHRFGLGALHVPNPVSFAALRLSPAVQQQTVSIHLIVTPTVPSLRTLYTDGAITLTHVGLFGDDTLVLSVVHAYVPGDPGTGETVDTLGGEQVTIWSAATPSGSAPLGATHDLVVRRDGTTGLVELLLDGVVVLSHANPRPLRFLGLPPSTGFGSGGVTYHRLRVWARVLSDTEHRAAIWRWRRNGIEWLAELLALGGYRMQAIAGAWARAFWHVVEHGSLVVDGWMTQETELRSALLAVALMRSVRLTMAADGQVVPTVPTASPSTTAALGHGDQYGNLTAIPQRIRASQTEAPRELAVRFRRQRAGDVTDFGRTIRRPVFAAGSAPITVDLPFVDDPVSADIVGDWLSKRLIARDQLIRAETGRDARDVVVGDRVTLDVPGMGIAWDAEAIGRELGAQRQAVSLVPWAAAAFTYTPQPLPPDPVPPLFAPLDLGTAPFLSAQLLSGRVRLEVVPADIETLRPVGTVQLVTPRELGGFWALAVASVVGGPTAHGVLDESVVGGDASYVRIYDQFPPDVVNTNVCTFQWSQPPATAQGTLVRVVQRLRAWRGATDHDERIGPLFPAAPLALSTTPTTYAWTFDTLGAASWTRESLDRLQAGWVSSSADMFGTDLEFFVAAAGIDVYLRVGTREGFVVYRRVGPSATQPPTPAADAPIAVQAADFGPQVDDPGGSSGQTFWYWAWVYDRVGRLMQILGPASVVVP